LSTSGPLHPPSFSLLPFLRLHPFSSSSLFLFPFLLPPSFSRVFSLFILPFSSSSSFHPPSTVHHHHHFNDFSRRSSSVSPTVPSYSVLSSSIPSDYCVVLVCSPTSSSHPTTNRHPAISPTLPLLSVPSLFVTFLTPLLQTRTTSFRKVATFFTENQKGYSLIPNLTPWTPPRFTTLPPSLTNP
jgi:hypothetical protein